MLKVGIIGTGHIGKIHLNILDNSPFFDLIGFLEKLSIAVVGRRHLDIFALVVVAHQVAEPVHRWVR